jgi:alpha-beta hydrolase superfamily lysophospholipase
MSDHHAPHTPAGLESAASVRVRRTPFYFQSQGAWLFGWLHQGESSPRCQRGVVLAAPLGYEQIHAHRSLRHLADALAEAGFAVLRFDYHGTGDSAGVDEDADRHATWLANLRSAIDWMRGELGCAEISIVGIRLGATLAAQVAADEPVADLVLWAPVVKGRAYVREMKFLSKAAGVPVDASKDIEAAGFVMAKQTAHELAGIDLMQVRPRCRRALLVDRDDMPADAQLLAHLRGLGIEARQAVQPGYAKMMAEPHHTKVPHQAIAEIVSWFCGGEAGAQAELPPERAWPAEALMAGKCSGLLRERALCLCRLPNLFGILSEPVAHPTAPGEFPVVVLLNAGSAHHVGPNRLHVLLARRLAAAGLRCLRMDLHGLGDSVTPNSNRENETYPATAFRDIDLAMKFLEREIGVGRTVLMGLCSGAYAAFQSAVQFTNPALLECVMINPLTFYWQEGMTVDSAQSLQLGNQQPQRVRSDSGPAAFPSHPLTNDLPGDLVRTISAKRLLTFFFARSDPGYDILAFFAKRLVEEMCRAGQMRICFIEDADHTFMRRGPREALLDAIVADLSGRYCSAATLGAVISGAAIAVDEVSARSVA